MNEGRVHQIRGGVGTLVGRSSALSRRLARTGARPLDLGVLGPQVVHLVDEDVGLDSLPSAAAVAAVLVAVALVAAAAAVVRGGVVVAAAVVGAGGVGGLPAGVEPEVVAVREVDVADVVHLVDGHCGM